MVAKISFPKSLDSALNYNEKKLERGIATCIYAGNYLRDAGEMNKAQKRKVLHMRNSLNERAQTKTVHISLNFPRSENLSGDTPTEIAKTYMERIGFGAQPYLVYEHRDAGHPHIHIVATAIREDGSRINTHNLGRGASAHARREIEILFGLKKAAGVKKEIQPAPPQKLIYGVMETGEGIANVVAHVFPLYHYTSLAAYNAALRSFNVFADSGTEGGKLAQRDGLYYRVMDASGKKLGVPIKASTLPHKPTLKNLLIQLERNEKKGAHLKFQVIDRVESSLVNPPPIFDDWIKGLEARGITPIVHRSKDGRPFGISFVDHHVKAVFKGSELGRHLSVGALTARFHNNEELTKGVPVHPGKGENDETKLALGKPALTNGSVNLKNMGEGLMLPYPLSSGEPPPLQLRKKRKRKKGNNH